MARQLGIKFNQFILRITTAFKVLAGRKSHFIVLFISEDELIKMIRADSNGDTANIDLDMIYHRLQKYNVYRILQMLANSKDEDDMVLLKADYEAGAQILKESKNKK